MSKVKAKFFKAKKDTKTIKKNQKVWVIDEFAHHAFIWYKYRARGRYLFGVIAKFRTAEGWNHIIGEDGIQEIEIDDTMYKAITEKKNKRQKGETGC